MTENKIYKATTDTFSPEYILNSPIGWKINFDTSLSEIKRISRKLNYSSMHLNASRDNIFTVTVNTDAENMLPQIKALLNEPMLVSNLSCTFTLPMPSEKKSNLYTLTLKPERQKNGDYVLKSASISKVRMPTLLLKYICGKFFTGESSSELNSLLQTALFKNDTTPEEAKEVEGFYMQFPDKIKNAYTKAIKTANDISLNRTMAANNMQKRQRYY